MEWVQVLRGLAATMVLFYHLGLFETKVFGSKLITPDFLKAGEAGVDVFFVISGFIMVFITPQRLEFFSGCAEFLCRRFTRVFPPYWIVSCVLLAVWLHKPELFNHFYHNQMDIGRSLFLLPQSFTPLVGVGWSLIHESYFYLVVSGLLVFGVVGRINLLILWSMAVLLANVLGLSNIASGHPWLQLISSPFSLEFQMGIVVALCYKKVAAWYLPVWLYILLAIGSITAIYVIGQFTPVMGVYPNNNHLFRVGCYGLASFLAVLCVVQLDASPIPLKAPVWAILLGDASYALYLVHIPIIDALYKIFSVFTPHPARGLALVYFFVVLAVIYAGAIIFHTQLERRLITFFHKLINQCFSKPALLPNVETVQK